MTSTTQTTPCAVVLRDGSEAIIVSTTSGVASGVITTSKNLPVGTKVSWNRSKGFLLPIGCGLSPYDILEWRSCDTLPAMPPPPYHPPFHVREKGWYLTRAGNLALVSSTEESGNHPIKGTCDSHSSTKDLRVSWARDGRFCACGPACTSDSDLVVYLGAETEWIHNRVPWLIASKPAPFVVDKLGVYKTRGGKTVTVDKLTGTTCIGEAKYSVEGVFNGGSSQNWTVEGRHCWNRNCGNDLVAYVGPVPEPTKPAPFTVDKTGVYETRGGVLVHITGLAGGNINYPVVGGRADKTGRPDLGWTYGGTYWKGLEHSFDIVKYVGPLPEAEPAPFVVDKLGLYKTRDGATVHVLTIRSGSSEYPIRGSFSADSKAAFGWTLNGSYYGWTRTSPMDIVKYVGPLPEAEPAPFVVDKVGIYKTLSGDTVHINEIKPESRSGDHPACGQHFQQGKETVTRTWALNGRHFLDRNDLSPRPKDLVEYVGPLPEPAKPPFVVDKVGIYKTRKGSFAHVTNLKGTSIAHPVEGREGGATASAVPCTWAPDGRFNAILPVNKELDLVSYVGPVPEPAKPPFVVDKVGVYKTREGLSISVTSLSGPLKGQPIVGHDATHDTDRTYDVSGGWRHSGSPSPQDLVSYVGPLPMPEAPKQFSITGPGVYRTKTGQLAHIRDINHDGNPSYPAVGWIGKTPQRWALNGRTSSTLNTLRDIISVA